MRLQVIGAGVGRTGTHSLKVALERLLGGTCHHMAEVFPSEAQKAGWTAAAHGDAVDWEALLGGFSAIVDWPGAAFWEPLSEANPDAVILLSTRSTESWVRSVRNTIFLGVEAAAAAGDPWMEAFVGLAHRTFCDDLTDEAKLAVAFEAHNDRVRATAPAARLLEWTAADGWDPICERLGLPVPSEPFPVTNSTKDFREMLGLPPVEV